MTPNEELSYLENKLDDAMSSLHRNQEKVQFNIRTIQFLEQRIDQLRHTLLLSSEPDEEV